MDILTQSIVPAVAKALGHFIWQGALLGLAAYVVTSLMRPRASARYVIGVACLFAMAVMPLATTFYVMAPTSSTFALSAGHAGGVVTSFDVSTGPLNALSLAPTSPWSASVIVVALWLIGVLALSVRLLGGWVLARRLAHRTRDVVSSEVQRLAGHVAERLSLARVVRILESPTIGAPMMMGWIKPVVILPTAALAGLTPLQVEALLAHELAHVRRHDYLINLLQSVIETLLFYHPAVWWVSRQVRDAREECCDDVAIGICDRVVYASALADLAAIAGGPRLALAATDGSLIGRVRRILGAGESSRRPKGGWLPAALVVLAITGLAPMVLASASAGPFSPVQQAVPPAPSTSPATTAANSAPQTSAQPAVAPQSAPQPPQEPQHAKPSDERVLRQDQIDNLRALEKRLEALRVPQGSDLDQIRDEMTAKLNKLMEAVNREMANSAKLDDESLRALKQQLEEAQATLELSKDETLRAYKKMTDEATVENEKTKAEIAQLNAAAAEAGENANAMADDLKLKLAKAKESFDETYLNEGGALAGGAKTDDSQGAISLLRIVSEKAPGRVLVVGAGQNVNLWNKQSTSLSTETVATVDWHEGLTAEQALELGKQTKVRILLRGSTPTPTAGGAGQLSRLVGVDVAWENGQVRADVRTEPIEPKTPLHDGDVLFIGSPIR